MWKKFDMDFKLECDMNMECGFSPPPEFNLPPPPLPPFLKELPKCSETSTTSDYEMCSLIPYIDFDYNNSSMQASAMILLCSVLVLIFIFVSSIFIWKHKRRMKDSLPYKSSSSTGSPMEVFNGYENPDAFIIRYKTLERQQQHFNMLQPKTVHYPSGFPMPQTPPVFICSSPGPDPYESNDNLYEELDQPDSELSHNDSHDRAALSIVPSQVDHLNSSADTAIVTDEISNNNETTMMAASSSSSSSSTSTTRNGIVAPSPLSLALGVNENEVERRNRINAQMSNTAFSVATIFRDRNNLRSLQQRHPHHHSATAAAATATTTTTTPRANANYYAPSHSINGINSSSNRVNSSDGNCQFLTNPRAMHCWGSGGQYEPVISSVYNSQCLNNNLNYHHNGGLNESHQQPNFSTMRNFSSVRSPHHISQNTINSSKNIWSWFRSVRRQT